MVVTALSIGQINRVRAICVHDKNLATSAVMDVLCKDNFCPVGTERGVQIFRAVIL